MRRARTYGKEEYVNGSRLPLPLELTPPVILAGELNAQAQLCSSTSSRMHCKSVNHTGVQIDVSVDVQVDDVIG